MNWRENLVEDDRRITDLLRGVRRIAVIGIKTERQAAQPAFFVPAYLQRAGFEVIPVPVYYPEVQEILGRRVIRGLDELDGEPADLVVLFRRPRDVPGHLDELLRHRPAAVWMQSGIRHAGSAEQLARAGILVVQDRCAMIEHRALR